MKTFLQLYSIAKTPKNQNFSLSQIYLISLPPKVYFFHHSLLVAVVVAVVVLVGPFYKERREKKVFLEKKKKKFGKQNILSDAKFSKVV